MKQHFVITPQQKAAAILIAMGKDHAKAVLEHLKSDELRIVLEAGRSLSTVSQSDLTKLVKEFEKLFIEGSGIVDTKDAIDDLLGIENEGGMPATQSKLVTNSVEIDGTNDNQPQSLWEKIETVDTAKIAERLSKEPPYIISAVLTKLQPNKAAAILSSLPDNLRSPVMTGMMSLKEEEALPLSAISTALSDDLKVGEEASGNINPRIPEILNTMKPSDCDALLASLRPTMSEKDFALLEGQLFRFDDIVKLEKPERTILLDSLSADLLTDALRATTPELQEAVLSAIGQRMRKMIEGELAAPSNIDEQKVDDARRSIAQLAVKMSSEGKFEIPKRAA